MRLQLPVRPRLLLLLLRLLRLLLLLLLSDTKATGSTACVPLYVVVPLRPDCQFRFFLSRLTFRESFTERNVFQYSRDETGTFHSRLPGGWIGRFACLTVCLSSMPVYYTCLSEPRPRNRFQFDVLVAGSNEWRRGEPAGPTDCTLRNRKRDRTYNTRLTSSLWLARFTACSVNEKNETFK